ncbi:MAG TPA: hypothetical protein VGM56_16550 [Byssovorax sp.]|jgi:hypothetical protein
MRTSLFLSSLFAVSLVGGVALADMHGRTDSGRAHGDQIDKNYRSSADRAATPRASAPVRTAAPVPQGSHTRSPVSQKETDRINCAPDSDACGHTNHAARARGVSQSTPASGAKSSSKNPFAQRESHRVNCSDGDECTASSKASKALGSKDSAKSSSSTAVQSHATTNRKDAQVNVRMSCNEGDVCSMSSKDAQKFWRAESFKHGTESASKALAIEDFQRGQKEKMERQKYEKPSDKPANERNRDAAHNPTPDHGE